MVSCNNQATQLPTPLDNKNFVRVVLYLCADENGIFESSTRLQKLVFLAQNKFPEFKALGEQNLYIDEPFTFAADNYGPFSKDLVSIVKSLEADGEIKITREGSCSTKYALNDQLRTSLSSALATLEEPVVKQWLERIVATGDLKLDQLLRYVYQDATFREYLIRSRIRNRYSLS